MQVHTGIIFTSINLRLDSNPQNVKIWRYTVILRMDLLANASLVPRPPAAIKSLWRPGDEARKIQTKKVVSVTGNNKCIIGSSPIVEDQQVYCLKKVFQPNCYRVMYVGCK